MKTLPETRARELVGRFLDPEDRTGASDFIEGIYCLAEESSGTEFGKALLEVTRWYDSDSGLGPEELLFRVDSLLKDIPK